MEWAPVVQAVVALWLGPCERGMGQWGRGLVVAGLKWLGWWYSEVITH